jgi:hypothetical protein
MKTKVYKYSEERRRHMSEARKKNGTSSAQYAHLHAMHKINSLTGRTKRPFYPTGKDHYLFGKHHTEESKLKLKIANKGHAPPNKGLPMSEEQKKKLSIAKIGKPAGCKGKPRPSVQGEKHWNWRGGASTINELFRTSLEYKLWRESVFKRDSFTCQECKQVGGTLHVHHIKPFSTHPELRTAIDNDITLCKKCHIATPTYAGKMMKKKNKVFPYKTT